MKAVAIPYVIALVLGVVVIGLLGYWFVNQSSKTIGIGSKTECDVQRFNFCQGWKISKFGNEPSGFTFGESCNKPDKNVCTSILGCRVVVFLCKENEICYNNGEICKSSDTCPGAIGCST